MVDPVVTKVRRRRLARPANVRALVASVLRAVENDSTLKPGEKYRLQLNGAETLLRAIAAETEAAGEAEKLRAAEKKILEIGDLLSESRLFRESAEYRAWTAKQALLTSGDEDAMPDTDLAKLQAEGHKTVHYRKQLARERDPQP
jgi:hypothetical protein